MMLDVSLYLRSLDAGVQRPGPPTQTARTVWFITHLTQPADMSYREVLGRNEPPATVKRCIPENVTIKVDNKVDWI